MEMGTFLSSNLQWVRGVFGGVNKRGIKEINWKKILSFSQLRTAAAYAEAVFNERPLHVMVDSDPDYVPITPNLLVFGRNLRLLGHDMLEINL